MTRTFAAVLGVALVALDARAERGESTSAISAGLAVGRDALGASVRVEQGYEPHDAWRILGALELSRRGNASSPYYPSPFVLHLLLQSAWCFACGDAARLFVFAGGGPAMAFGGHGEPPWLDLAAAAGVGFSWRFGWGWGLRVDLEGLALLGLSPVTDRARDALVGVRLGPFLEY